MRGRISPRRWECFRGGTSRRDLRGDCEWGLIGVKSIRETYDMIATRPCQSAKLTVSLTASRDACASRPLPLRGAHSLPFHGFLILVEVLLLYFLTTHWVVIRFGKVKGIPSRDSCAYTV